MLSRVADGLYWMSRYLERAEHTARLVDVNLSLSLEQSPDASTRRWERVLASLRTRAPQRGVVSGEDAAHWLAFDFANPNSVASCVESARDNARQVREQISAEMWQHINRLYFRAREAVHNPTWEENPRDFLSGITETCHLVQGVTEATLGHGEGWHFIQVGRYMERAANTATLLDVQFAALQSAGAWRESERRDQVDTYLDWVGLLNSCAAFDAYCKVYTAALRPDRIAEFLVLNPEFPHAIHFAAAEMEAAMRAIGRATHSHRAPKVTHLARRLWSTLHTSHAQDLTREGLNSHLRYVLEQCRQIHQAVYHAYFAYPVEEELAA